MQPPLHVFADFIRQVDAHAEHRLRLVEQVEPILYGDHELGWPERRASSEKLERWRYQHCVERRAGWTGGDQSLVDALDQACRALAGRKPLPPRRSRLAVEGRLTTGEAAATAETWLDANVALPALAREAAQVTREPFVLEKSARRRMLLYAPLYLSNYCANHCSYCGFQYSTTTGRRHLDVDEVLAEAGILVDRGFRHILLAAGDFPRRIHPEYLEEIVSRLAAMGVRPVLGVAPQSTAVYERLARAGACGVTLFQETYDETRYAVYHPRGPKRAFDWRLEALDRSAEAGMKRLELGILLGLADPRQDLLAMIRHGAYLQERFPRCTLAFSLPRITEAPGGFAAPFSVDSETLVRFYGVLRMVFPGAELVLSTREPAALRNRLARICITQMSAGSRTSPGGYGNEAETSASQFPIRDHREPAEVAGFLRDEGIEPVWLLDDFG